MFYSFPEPDKSHCLPQQGGQLWQKKKQKTNRMALEIGKIVLFKYLHIKYIKLMPNEDAMPGHRQLLSPKWFNKFQ
jgi:hypothetical protein